MFSSQGEGLQRGAGAEREREASEAELKSHGWDMWFLFGALHAGMAGSGWLSLSLFALKNLQTSHLGFL